MATSYAGLVPLPGLAHRSRAYDDELPCATIDPDTFFPARGQGGTRTYTVRAAKRVCLDCPVLERCLQTALALTPASRGIWAGHTDRERRAILARLAAAPDADRPKILAAELDAARDRLRDQTHSRRSNAAA